MKFCLFIFIFYVCVCNAQNTTENLILNNSFEQSFYNTGLLEDSSYQTTNIECWVKATDYNYQTFFYDNVDIVGAIVTYPYFGVILFAEHLQKAVWLDGVYGESIPTIQTKLLQPLTAGITYRLSGYINSTPYIGERYDTVSWWRYTHPKRVGFYFTENKIYNSGNAYSNANLLFQISPAVTYTFAPFQHDYYNAWRPFELVFTATGNERYLTISYPDTELYLYPKADSIIRLNNGGVIDGSHAVVYLDNLSLIPLADTGKTILNKHIASPDSIFTKHTADLCNGAGSVVLSTSAVYASYQWSTGDTTRNISVSETGRYAVTVDNGCVVYADTIIVRPAPVLAAFSDTQYICNDSSIILSAQNEAESYVWSTGAHTQSIAIRTPQTYYCTVSGSCSSVIDTFFITTILIADTRQTFQLSNGEELTLSACATGDKYAWFLGTEKLGNNPEITVSPKQVEQTYTCIVSIDSGCAQTCIYNVKVNGIYGNIYVPNAFSPNGDGKNDVFEIFGKYIRVQYFAVFNRWGEKVYETTNANPAWNGTFKGVPQPAGVYTYELTYFSGVQSVAEFLRGTITVVR